MRYRIVVIAALIGMGIFSFLSQKLFSGSREQVDGSIYDITMNGLDGQPVDFARYKGKNLLIVNTASKCGYTPQYEALQKLHEQYGDQVVILGFPANNFLWQEPGNNSDIAAFCQKNYGVTFQMFEKISVKGKDQHPLYRWLTARSGKKPSWNFCKYLVDKNGEVAGFFGPKVDPLDESIIKFVTR